MSNVRLTIRQPPHRDYVQHYPGLTGLRATPNIQQGQEAVRPEDQENGSTSMDAALIGAVEVRTNNNSPVQAQYLRIELKKTETVLTSKGLRRYFELIGSQENTLWSGKAQESADQEGFAPIETGDFSFRIPIPTGLPPSAVIDKAKGTGIVYHLVATLLVRPIRKSFFSPGGSQKAPTPVAQAAEVLIEKHELNPAWPIYPHQAQKEAISVSKANLILKLTRDTVMYGGGDPMNFSVDLQSERATPIKLAKLELVLREIITAREAPIGQSAPGSPDPRKTLQQANEVVTVKSSAQKLLYKGESTIHTLSATFPTTHYRYTIQNAKHIDIKYLLRLRAIIEMPKESKIKKGDDKAKEEPIKELVLDNIPVLVSPWGKKHGEWWKVKIGQTPPNLRAPGTPQTQVSNQASRRHSSVIPGNPTTVNNQQLPTSQSQPTIASGSREPANGLDRPMPIVGRVTAESLATGRRLSSFPPPVDSPAESFTGIGSGNYLGQHRAGQQVPLYQSQQINGQTSHSVGSPSAASDSGHDYRPYRIPNGDGHRHTVNMNGSYPSLSKSTSHQEQVRRPSNELESADMASRRVVSNPAAPVSLSPFGSPQAQLPTSSPSVPGMEDANKRYSMPAVSNLPMNVQRKRDTLQPVTAFEMDRRQATSDIGHAEYLRRKGTLSTITGSPPESPASDTPSPLPSTNWLGPDSEQSTGPVRQGINLLPVQGRAGTPLSLARAMSNPTPRTANGFSSFAQLEPVVDTDQTQYRTAASSTDSSASQLPSSSESETPQPARPAQATYTSSSLIHQRSSSGQHAGAVDEQKLRYLKALAAREAYQRRMAGGQEEPLSALEEKRKLQKLYETENREELALADMRATEPEQVYSPGSVYLTAATEYQQQPFFASQTSFSPSPSDTSHSSASQPYQRDPMIARGKQRHVSMYSNGHEDEDQENLSSAPQRPPKPPALLQDLYRHLDSPASPTFSGDRRRSFVGY